MMVRNESRVIRRALDSVAGQVDSWSITDTGSTDDTPEIVAAHLAELGIPGRLHHEPFVDFGATRSAALNHALREARERGDDYLLILDADEELVVRDPHWKEQLDGAPLMLLQDGALAYRVMVLVPTAHDWHYVGRTHEYLTSSGEVPSRRSFDGVGLRHHGDGGSKSDKFTRDARLLRLTLAEQPDDARSWFYLGESLLNGNIDIAAALDAYTRRAELGGFEEEAWYAAYRLGHCLERMMPEGGDPWPTVLAHLRAWERRPWRAEPLTEVVRIAVQRDLPMLGLVLGEYALQHVVPRSERDADILFVNLPLHGARLLDWTSLAAAECGYPARAVVLAEQALVLDVEEHHAERIGNNLGWFRSPRTRPNAGSSADLLDAARRLREEGLHRAATILTDAAAQLLASEGRPEPWQLDFERSISLWYLPGRREAAKTATNRVIARRDTPQGNRAAARDNRRFVVAPLPGLVAAPLRIDEGVIPLGYRTTNPSIATLDGELRVVVRAVNYRIRPDGGYDHPGFIDTRNFIGLLGADGSVRDLREIAVPVELAANEGSIRGYEDLRFVPLVRPDGLVEMVANRHHSDDPRRRAMYRLMLADVDTAPRVVAAHHLRHAGEAHHEKNWMPLVRGGRSLLVYSADPTVVLEADAEGVCAIVASREAPVWCADLRGGSQLVEVPLPGGGIAWLALMHGVLTESPRRSYFHAMVLWSDALQLMALSDPFVLQSQQVEFVAGCTRVGDELWFTWGQDDAEAWMGRIRTDEAVRLCLDGAATRMISR